MEDAHLALPDFDPERKVAIYGVFDGHGGAAVSKVAVELLPGVLRGLDSYKQGRYAAALREALLKVDEILDSAEGRRRIKECLGPEAEEEEEDEIPEDMLRELIESGQVKFAEEGEEETPQTDEAEGDDEAMAKSQDLVKPGAETKAKAKAGDLEAPTSAGEDKMDDEDGAETDCNKAWAEGEGPDGMGTTAVVALVHGGDSPEVFCANVGDSRAVLARGDKAVALSRDHKPTTKSERRRIESAGGFVSPDERVDGNLNLSRALGDFAYKKDPSLKATEQKISPEAEVRRKRLCSADDFLLIGCDGIFEKATNQALWDFLRQRAGNIKPATVADPADKALSTACSDFLDYNIAKSPHLEQGLGCDNMTLMMVDLRSMPRSKGPGVGGVWAPVVFLNDRRVVKKAATKATGGVRRSIHKGRQGLMRSQTRRRLKKLTKRHHSAKAAEDTV